jgi:hypothetical protein
MTAPASRESKLAEYMLSLFLSLPLVGVMLVVRFGPAAEPGLPALIDYWLPLSAAILVPSLLIFRLVLSTRLRLRFTSLLVAAEILFVVASIAAGALVHRDFFTAAFQYLLGASIIVLYKINAYPSPELKKGLQRSIGRAGVVVAVFYVEWIMLMGYAISTRAEPRPIESIIYNLYNLAQVLILLLSSLSAQRKSFHTVLVGKDELAVDGRDIVPVLGQKKAAIFRALALAPDRRLRCPEVQALFRGEGDEAGSRCAACSESTTKAALCGKYRNTYNGILELKRMLEFLEIGTITASENKRHILTEGWKLSLFEDVRIEQRKK